MCQQNNKEKNTGDSWLFYYHAKSYMFCHAGLVKTNENLIAVGNSSSRWMLWFNEGCMAKCTGTLYNNKSVSCLLAPGISPPFCSLKIHTANQISSGHSKVPGQKLHLAPTLWAQTHGVSGCFDGNFCTRDGLWDLLLERYALPQVLLLEDLSPITFVAGHCAGRLVEMKPVVF